jgi:hypothetical protein
VLGCGERTGCCGDGGDETAAGGGVLGCDEGGGGEEGDVCELHGEGLGCVGWIGGWCCDLVGVVTWLMVSYCECVIGNDGD